MKKTVCLSINDSVFDIPRLLALSMCVSDTQVMFLINKNNKKKEIIESFIGSKLVCLNYLLIIVFTILGFIYLPIILKVNKAIRRAAFYSYILNRKPRLGSYRHVSPFNLWKLRCYFIVRQAYSVGLFKYLHFLDTKRIIFEERTKTPEILLYHLCLRANIQCIQFIPGAIPNCLVAKKLDLENQFEHPMAVSNWMQSVDKFDYEYKHFTDDVIIEDFYKKMIKQRYVDNRWYNRDKIEKNLNRKPYKFEDFSSYDVVTVVAMHIFWDATFAYGKNTFDDYCTWFDECVNLASQKPNHLFLIKLHPDLLWKAKVVKVGFDHLKYVLEKVKSLDNCKVLSYDIEINNLELMKNIDIVLTVRGTFGLEAACVGLKVLTAGTGRYDNLGFTFDCSQKENFFDTYNQAVTSATNQEWSSKAKFLFFYLFAYKHHPVPGLLDDFDRTKSAVVSDIIKSFDHKTFLDSEEYLWMAKWLISHDMDLLNNQHSMSAINNN